MGQLLNNVSNPNYLFNGFPLQDNLASAAQEAFDALQNWAPDALLNAPEADVIDALLRKATFEVPNIDRDGAHLDDPEEIYRDFPRSGGETGKQLLTRQTLIVPISGPVMFFHRSASMSSLLNPISAQFDLDNPPNLLLHCDGESDPAKIRAYFEKELDRIEERLAWTQADVRTHNQAMRSEIPKRVGARRAKLLEDRNIQASIGFPIKRRHAAGTYSVPISRETIRPRQTTNSCSTTPYKPEPALDDADYEAALTVLRSARNMLERSRSMTSKMGEEEIRDLLLVMLNGHFQGAAGGEVFNCIGKTDILIREQDRHVFIAECKVIDPKHKQSVEHIVSSGLSQLLSYLTWRDTKAALLLFVRDADLTTVTNKAVAMIREHTNHKRDGLLTNEERHDFVLHANGDPNREIRMAFLPIHVGSIHDQKSK